ncbi:hypothetical protein [Deinococcus aerolatus]|uniref:hypothetical protein n=1 Tax=Deinococcus aerolatus TaxID=522487 RepID=UPI001663546D|nr:hypothetical protein [Deinococcus aerolatus]
MFRFTARKLLELPLILGVLSVGLAQAQTTMTYGNFAYFQNQYPSAKFYLTAFGQVKNYKEFALVNEANNFVAAIQNIQSASGNTSWALLSKSGKNKGEAVLYGDEIYLVNKTPYFGYLDTAFAVKDLPAYQAGGYGAPGKALLGVFTVTKPDRGGNPTSTWKIIPAPGVAKKDGDMVMANDNILLVNVYTDALRPDNGGYLDAMGYFTDVPAFRSGTNKRDITNVFTTMKPNRDTMSSVWKITPGR